MIGEPKMGSLVVTVTPDESDNSWEWVGIVTENAYHTFQVHWTNGEIRSYWYDDVNLWIKNIQ